MTLGEAIKKYRDEHDLSMRAFAAKCGLSVTYISSLEKGITPRGIKPAPTIETYKLISEAMGVELDAFIRMVNDKVYLNAPAPDPLEEEKQRLLSEIAALSPEDIKKVLEYARFITKDK